MQYGKSYLANHRGAIEQFVETCVEKKKLMRMSILTRYVINVSTLHVGSVTIKYSRFVRITVVQENYLLTFSISISPKYGLSLLLKINTSHCFNASDGDGETATFHFLNNENMTCETRHQEISTVRGCNVFL